MTKQKIINKLHNGMNECFSEKRNLLSEKRHLVTRSKFLNDKEMFEGCLLGLTTEIEEDDWVSLMEVVFDDYGIELGITKHENEDNKIVCMFGETSVEDCEDVYIDGDCEETDEVTKSVFRLASEHYYDGKFLTSLELWLANCLNAYLVRAEYISFLAEMIVKYPPQKECV